MMWLTTISKEAQNAAQEVCNTALELGYTPFFCKLENYRSVGEFVANLISCQPNHPVFMNFMETIEPGYIEATRKSREKYEAAIELSRRNPYPKYCPRTKTWKPSSIK